MNAVTLIGGSPAVTFVPSICSSSIVSTHGLACCRARAQSSVGVGSAQVTASLAGQTATALVTDLLTSATPIIVSGGQGSDLSYFLQVLPATASVTVTLRNGTGNPNLIIYRSAFSTGLADCRSEAPTSTETCVVSSGGAAGPFEIRIIGGSAYSNVTLTATRSP